MTITPLQWVSFAVCVLIAIGATFRIRALRTRPVTDLMYRSMRSWWPWGEALLRGWIRMTPTAIGGLWIVLAGLASGIPSTGAERGTPLYALGYVFVVTIVMLAIWIGAMISITLINRPRFLVAPHLQSEPGALATWFRGEARRGRSRR
jgi:hypothetical protein